MNYNNLHYKIALTLLHGIGPIKAKEILKRVGSIELLFTLSASELSKLVELKSSVIQKMKREEALLKSISVAEHLTRNEISTYYFEDDGYPRRLLQCVDAPLLLYGKGNGDLNVPKIVAVVGTRDATIYGRRLCDELIASFDGQDILVISGLALGIDAQIHKNCIDAGVSTIGVLGHGFDRIYPAKNKSLSEKMISCGGLLTEFIPGTNPDRENFPKRNRIVAGLCDATIVIESKIKGGSLITANLANDYNRDVFAYPGSIHMETSQGCNKLIADQKAHLLQSPDDFLTMMNWKNDTKKNDIQKALFHNLSEIQTKITDIISLYKSIQIDVISLKAELPISQLNAELFLLEMSGVIQALPGKKYCIA